MYYLELFLPETGEVIVHQKGFPSIKGAVKHAKNYINHSLDTHEEGEEFRIDIFDKLPPEDLERHQWGEPVYAEIYYKKTEPRDFRFLKEV